MIGTPHMLTGALLASRTRSPRVAFTVGVLSHLALDTIPHTDYPVRSLYGGVALSDLVGGAVLTGALTGEDPVMMAGALGGVVPDLIAFSERAVRVRLTRIVHEAIHTNVKPPLWLGVTTQVVSGAAALYGLTRVAARRRRVPVPSAPPQAPPSPASQVLLWPQDPRLDVDAGEQRRAA